MENYPDLSHRIMTDKEAAEVYLAFFNYNEAGDMDDIEFEDLGFGTKDEVKEKAKKLDVAGYPHPNDVIYDNEGQPLIYWTDPNFDWDGFVEEFNKEHGCQ